MHLKTIWKIFLGIFLSFCSIPAMAAAQYIPDVGEQPLAMLALWIFAGAYVLVMLEEVLHLRKSKPVMLAAGLIWIIVSLMAAKTGTPQVVNQLIGNYIREYAELFIFLLVAMTYINAMQERKVFDSLRYWLVDKHFTYRQLFWITGTLAFFISPIADNLTTALILCAVVLAVGKDNHKFVSIACINIVVAANAGGAFSPFGDITTLMVWNAGKVEFVKFFTLFIPSLVNFLIPAACMHFAIPNQKASGNSEHAVMKKGAKRIIILFLLTIYTAVMFHNYLHLPPAIGMATGFAYLQFFGYFLRIDAKLNNHADQHFDIFDKVRNAEWDTLLFFYGVILCVGGLSALGYLHNVSNIIYTEWGQGLSAAHQQTPANIVVGLLSSVIDNIPVMLSILDMNPSMSQGQWLLATLTAGVGGSLLSIGSAAGVALMGQARGKYTFLSHLKWSWAIMLGYIASILTHLWLNTDLF